MQPTISSVTLLGNQIIKKKTVRERSSEQSDSTSKVSHCQMVFDHIHRHGRSRAWILLRKEVIQPHLPIRLPCYDFTPVIGLTLRPCFLAVSAGPLGPSDSHGVTGGVYKARERIQRSLLICVY